MSVKQVWQAPDGKTFDTEEEAVEHDRRHSKIDRVSELYQASPHSVADFIVYEWEAIKAIIEGTS
jgi:hypothetical protein